MPKIPHAIDEELSDFLARWRVHLASAHGFGRVHIAQHINTLLQFLDVTGVKRTLKSALAIPSDQITAVIDGPRPAGLKNNPVVTLRRFFDFAILVGRLTTSPMPNTKGSGPGSKVKVLSADTEELLDEWEGWLFSTFRLTTATLSSDKRRIRLLAGALGASTLNELLGATPKQIGAYLDDREMCPSSRRSEWLAISRFFEFAVGRGLVEENPASAVEVSGAAERCKASSEVLTKSQIARIFDALGAREVRDWIKARDLCFVSLLYRPRLLAKEAARVTRADIGEQLRVRNRRGGTRLVDLDERSRTLLERYLGLLPFPIRDDEAIFRSSEGGTFRPDALNIVSKQLNLTLLPSMLRRSARAHFHEEIGGNVGLRAQSGLRRLTGHIGDKPPDGLFEEYMRLHPRDGWWRP